MGKNIFRVGVMLAAALSSIGLGAGALANDTMAELKTGGLSFVESDVIAMEREDLHISAEEIWVKYLFSNASNQDVETIVAFPMPDIKGEQYETVAIPREDDNFLGFTVSVEGQEITPNLDQHVTALGVDVTELLRTKGIPLVPASEAAYAALANIDAVTAADWIARGIIVNDIYDVGKGMEDHLVPVWVLSSTYWWRMVFPANQKITVQHRYTPSVGSTGGLGFLDYDGKRSERYDDYARDYCLDDGFMRAVDKRVTAAGNNPLPLWETRLSYIVMTGGNWNGFIETFHLTIDKGSTKNLVSFCGDGIKKTGPTTFELTYTDYYPQRDLDILILQANK